MRTGAAAGHDGYFHEAAFYGSDDQFVAAVVPFLRDGLTAGEPTYAVLNEAHEDLVRDAMADTPGVAFLDSSSRPATAIKAYRELIADQVRAGADQVRMVADVPHPGVGAPWDWWARYEAAANVAFDAYPVWGLCPYDTRITPAEVLADVERTHPRVVTTDGRHVGNSRFEEPASFLRRQVLGRDGLSEDRPPAIELVDPTPAEARHAVLDASRGTGLTTADVDGMVIAVSEAVTNAVCHGRPPVRVRLWREQLRLVVTVTDCGHGPDDPFAGLLPPNGGEFGGLGLWLVHQLCNHVAFGADLDGFTIRMVIGSPAA